MFILKSKDLVNISVFGVLNLSHDFLDIKFRRTVVVINKIVKRSVQMAVLIKLIITLYTIQKYKVSFTVKKSKFKNKKRNKDKEIISLNLF